MDIARIIKKYCLSICILISFFKAQAFQVTDHFLLDTDRWLDKVSVWRNPSQFEKLFPSLYLHDKNGQAQGLQNSLIMRLIDRIEKISQEKNGLSWCNCDQAPAPQRIRLALKVLDRVVRQYPECSQKLVYTSYASGKLLQDFIIIAGLIELGYSCLEINVIDIAYERKRQDLSCLYAQIVFEQQIRKILRSKQEQDLSYNPSVKISSYHNVYDYLEKARRGLVEKSHILIMVDPGNDLMHKDFEYYGQQALASLINFELENKMTHIALYIPRSKTIRYVYAQNLAYGDKEKIRKALESVKKEKLKKNYSEYITKAVCQNFPVKSIKYFQSPFRSFDDLKYDGAVSEVIMYQLCDGMITQDVRDGLPLRGFSKIWL